jgi:salicylate hydroxylase
VGPRVAIIGCGIEGITTAIALAQAGIEVAVYEQAPELGEVGAGVGMWANALRALHPLGMSDAVLALSAGPVSQGVRLPEGRWLLRQPREAMEARWGAGFISVHRAELHTLLASAVDPATIHLGVRCTGFEQTGATVRVHFADGPRSRPTSSSGRTASTRSCVRGSRVPPGCDTAATPIGGA